MKTVWAVSFDSERTKQNGATSRVPIDELGSSEQKNPLLRCLADLKAWKLSQQYTAPRNVSFWLMCDISSHTVYTIWDSIAD